MRWIKPAIASESFLTYQVKALNSQDNYVDLANDCQPQDQLNGEVLCTITQLNLVRRTALSHLEYVKAQVIMEEKKEEA